MSRRGIEIGLDNFDRLSRKVPVISRIIPTERATVVDLHNAGGVPAIVGALSSMLNLGAMTVSGDTVEDIIKDAESTDTAVLTTIEDPVRYRNSLRMPLPHKMSAA